MDKSSKNPSQWRFYLVRPDWTNSFHIWWDAAKQILKMYKKNKGKK
jgi:hypothetical protein